MRSSTPLICVIMPCYNAAPYVQQAIDSVLCQSHGDFPEKLRSKPAAVGAVLAYRGWQGVGATDQTNEPYVPPVPMVSSS